MSDASGEAFEVTVNGEARAVAAGSSVADLVAALGFTPKQVAVERNKLIVRRADHAETALQPGDQLEVVTFFGGG
jgi:sulfur carrier protein